MEKASEALRLQRMMSYILLAGTLISAGFVCVGGGIFLWHHGSMPFREELIYGMHYQISFSEMWQLLQRASSIGLIELGLICLVMTQVLRVALLCVYYTITRDTPFIFICLFILCVLLYSTLWHQ